MNYIDICKYVFAQEGQDFEARAVNCRKAGLVQARQRSMFLIKHFFPQMRWHEIGAVFYPHRETAHDAGIYAYVKVSTYISTEKKYEQEMSRYITVIRGMKNNKLKVNCVTATYKMLNKRVTLEKRDSDWLLTVKKLADGKPIKNYLTFTDEALEGILQCYNVLK